MVVGHPRARYAIPTAVVVLLLGDAMQTAARRARPRAASTSPSLLGCDASRSSSLDEHLSELPMLGMHVLRARDGAGCDGSGGDDAALLDVYVDGLQKDLFVREDYSRAAPNLELACPGGPQSSAAVSARAWLLRPLQRIVGRHRPRLVDRLVQQKKRLTQQAARELLNSTAAPDSDAALRRWKVFTPHGDGVTLARKTILQALAECDTLYVFEGGRFAWPGVSVGFKRTITLRADDAIAVATTFSLMPLVLSVEGLLTHAECDQIIAEAEPHMVASPVSKHAGERPGNDPGNATEDSWQELSLVRTSSQTRVPPGGDKTCLTLDRRAHRVLRVPDSHGEPLQVLRYHEAEFYDGKSESCFLSCSLLAEAAISLTRRVCREQSIWTTSILSISPTGTLASLGAAIALPRCCRISPATPRPTKAARRTFRAWAVRHCALSSARRTPLGSRSDRKKATR